MFWQRALVTFTLGPLALLVIYRGGLLYFGLLALIMLLGAVEYSRLMRRLGWHVAPWLLLPAVSLLLVDGQWPAWGLLAPALAGILLVVMGYSLWLYEKRRSATVAADWLVTVAGILLLGWLGSHFFRLRNLPALGWQWTMTTMVCIWSADSAAYAVGKKFGRHKLSPRLSPHKTVEGYLGGMAGGLVAALITASLVHVPLGPAALLALLLVTVAPLGDLGISLLKREAGVKDSGNLLPGHGGALDRTDSLVWAVTLAYYFLLYSR